MSVRSPDLRFVPLTAASAALAASWFVGDEDGAREFGGFYGNHPKWWVLVERDLHRFGWVIWGADEPCGFVDLDLNDDGRASVALYIRPAYRNRGVGRAALRALVPLSRGVGATALYGGVHPANLARLHAVVGAGGVITGEDDDGYLVVREPSPDSL